MNKTNNTVIPIDLGGVNSYLIATEKGFVLADTGGHIITDKTFDNRREKLMQALSAAGCSSLQLILLTHGDNDHTANAAYLRNTFKAPVAMHPADLELVKSPTQEMMMASFRYKSFLFRLIFRLMKKKIVKITKKILEDFESFKPDILLSDGMNLKEYGLDGTVIHLPGHTAGSIGLLLENGSLISGDTLVNMNKPASSPNAVDFAGLSHSIDKLHGKAIKIVYPGHGSPFNYRDL